MKFIVHDAGGNILRTGYCSQDDLVLQAGEGETAIEDAAEDTTDDTKHRIVNGERVEFTPVARAPGYVEQRVLEYPTIGDQLDAMWKGGADADAMRKLVQGVKSKFPKPE